MKIRLMKADLASLECDALIVPLFEDDRLDGPLPSRLNQKLGGLLGELRVSKEWKGQAGEILVIYRPDQLKAARVILLGLGKRAAYRTRILRNLVQQTIERLRGYDLKRVVVFLGGEIDATRATQAAVEGTILGSHSSDAFKTQNRAEVFTEEIVLATDGKLDVDVAEKAMERGRILGRATNLARDLVNQPGNCMTPTRFSEKCCEIAEGCGLEIEVLGEPEMKERGMNAILAVARGSEEPARFVVLRLWGASERDAKPIVWIGKGVTFDSGGLSLKSAHSMEDMKSDKAGACAVLAAMQSAAQLQIEENIVGLLAIVENLPSGRAQRPGDVIHSFSGRTIEVVNTDAEGRLILADALHFAGQLRPQYVIDIATLTGACAVALGNIRAGVFCNDDEVYQKLVCASKRSGERMWRLPLDDDYRKELESAVADLKNVGNRWGGAITAAKFLQEFVGSTPWIHMDIAGVDLVKEGPELKGSTGFGVRTLVEMALQ